MILFVNACVRSRSRTRRLADRILSGMKGPVVERRLLDVSFPVVDEGFLERRDALIREGRFGDPSFELAREFASAEEILIAAPFWDLSFPAMLKQYLEQINVVGITFYYSAEGIPVGLCKAGRLFYVSTAGGPYVPDTFGFGYIKALAETYYGIQDVRKIEAVGLDIAGADADAIMADAMALLAEMELD